MSMKNSNDPIGNRPRDLLACSAVPQPTEPPRVPSSSGLIHKKSWEWGQAHHDASYAPESNSGPQFCYSADPNGRAPDEILAPERNSDP